MQLWKNLLQVRSLTLRMRGKAGIGYGEAAVTPKLLSKNSLLFEERGTWLQGPFAGTLFSNRFLWSWDGKEKLFLAHFRHEKPVPLFTFLCSEEARWENQSPHLCEEDCYSSWLKIADKEILLQCKIEGPHKQEELTYCYTPIFLEALGSAPSLPAAPPL